MYPLQEPFLRHISQIAANRVLGDTHRSAHFLGNHLAVAFQNRKDFSFAVCSQHNRYARYYLTLHEVARYIWSMSEPFPPAERVRIKTVETLSDDWYVLKKTTFDFLRSDGTWQEQHRETYDRGNGAAMLLYNLDRRTVILTRQFRFPAFVNGHPGMLIEVPAGLLDMSSPEERIKVEVEEETGYRVEHVRKIFEAFMSPGSVTEKLYFFVAEYDAGSKAALGGGVHSEGEDIEVLESSIDDAMLAIKRGEIVDAKTIMLLQYACLNLSIHRENPAVSTDSAPN
jgi:nudix-type nucleoside diphosphatase (YffH/AdpP family)